jgi:hypothetical protein
MQTQRINANVLDRVRRIAILSGTIAAMSLFAATALTGSAASFSDVEGNESFQQLATDQDDASEKSSSEDGLCEPRDESADPASERFIPGFTDVLHAELDPQRIEAQDANPFPERPAYAGPYK